jgi:predicted NAD/FAD-dependent oxidoreductase
VTARGDAFGTVLDGLRRAGAAACWDDGSERSHWVGTPGMSALPRHLARGLDIRLEVEVTSVRPEGREWIVAAGDQRLRFDRVVVTAPAPQTAVLLGPDSPLAAEIARVRLDPCLTLMAALDPAAPRPFVSRADPDDPIAWIAQDSSKPGRPGAACWVAQASPAWSDAHLELERDAIAERMVPLLCERLGADPGAVRHAAAHRWRYAKVAVPLGRPFARAPSGTLHAGGDWCLDARVEAAWISGDAIARDILGEP